MKVNVFMNSAGHNYEREILRMMYNGISEMLVPKNKEKFKEWKKINKEQGKGAGVYYSYDEKYSSCDLAVILGSWKPDRSNTHHIVRSSIYENAKNFICIETPLLGRKVFEPNLYQRVGINGFLNRAAIFGEEKNYPSDRFQQLGLKYNGWRKKPGSKIIIAMQLAGDASLRHNDINEWCIDTVNSLRKYTDRPIEIRTHPRISNKGYNNYQELFQHFAFGNIKNLTFINGKELPWQEHLNDAYCVVTYTSGLSIDAILNGVPVIACDEGNFAWNVGERQLKNIEKLNLSKEEEVQQWLYNLAYCQWNLDEIESGKCWSHLYPSIKQLVDNDEIS